MRGGPKKKDYSHNWTLSAISLENEKKTVLQPTDFRLRPVISDEKVDRN